MLTPAQLAALKADILADGALSAFPNNSDGNFAVAAAYNLVSSPDFWVWRTNVSRADVYNELSPTSSTWNWTTYKNQSATEQNTWTQIFMGDQANFSKANVRAGIAAIFTGSAAANDQRDHCLAVGRRKAKRAEALFSAGTGSTASPATMGFEGNLTGQDVEAARNS